MSERTKQLRKHDILFHLISNSLCFILALIYIICCIVGSDSGNATMKDKLGTVIYGFGLSLIPMIVLIIIVGHKIKTTCWMLCVVLANYIFGSTVMYITFGVWLIDEYIISPLAKSYHNKYTINKEIDLRG